MDPPLGVDVTPAAGPAGGACGAGAGFPAWSGTRSVASCWDTSRPAARTGTSRQRRERPVTDLTHWALSPLDGVPGPGAEKSTDMAVVPVTSVGLGCWGVDAGVLEGGAGA